MLRFLTQEDKVRHTDCCNPKVLNPHHIHRVLLYFCVGHTSDTSECESTKDESDQVTAWHRQSTD